ncbi:MAG: tRNA (N(6)-L-threonylcarbamoyladenosine(37)-C(2))-methylthiotransferase MtaB [Bacilli bacterium]|nr:tRNA (N(6)-L-threonylcarbamoyladenosine(37)-C(2))-methylthiotransferase MtaB [Bacilli bacterium]
MKFNIITLGCKVNSYESNFMKEALVKNGFSFCNLNEKCDILILNTCTVTDTSDKKSLKEVRRLKRENPNAILVVCGCSVQNDKTKYDDLGINILMGNINKSNIVSIIEKYLDDKTPVEYVAKTRDLPFENMEVDISDHTRAYIKIEDGCDNFCSYCIIPFVRGKKRSKDFSLVLREVQHLANNGYKEIVLTGIDTGGYESNGKDLTDLIHEMSKINGIERIRQSSIEITQINEKFINELKNNNKICDHIHIPLQSGSDSILKLMNRKYDLKYFFDKIDMIRSVRPDISITTDVIVGFPGETEEMFLETMETCKKINFSKIHAFPYSERKGTKASMMDGKVPESVKHERVKKLLELSDSLEKSYYDKFKGKKLDVLIEEVNESGSKGHTSNYLMVHTDEKLQKGEIYNLIV